LHFLGLTFFFTAKLFFGGVYFASQCVEIIIAFLPYLHIPGKSRGQLSEVCTNMDNYYRKGSGQKVIATTKLLLLLLLLFSFTVSSTEGLTATCAAAFELS